MIRTGRPDLRADLAQVVKGHRARRDLVHGGTHRGELVGIPATGATATVAGISTETPSGTRGARHSLPHRTLR